MKQGKKKFKMNSTLLIFIALLLGLVTGLIFGEQATIFQPLGDIFLNLIKMLVIPLVMCSIIDSTSNMKDMKVLGRVGGKMLGLYLLTTAAAAAIGIAVATLARVGEGVVLASEVMEKTEQLTILGVLKNMVPSNIFESMANFDTLPCIIFSILFGIAIIVLGEKADPVKAFISSATETLYTLVGIIVKAAPVGIFCLIAAGIGQNGAEIFATLGKFVVLEYVGSVFVILMYILLIKFGAGMKITTFIKSASKIFITAFTTRSSSATLPVTLKVTTEELDVPNDIASFMLPIGTTINMNGAAMSLGMKAVLASFIFNSPLTIGQIAIAIVICTLSGVGMPGVPNSGLVFNIFLFSTLGFPAGALIGLLASVESLGDMINTSCNVLGDSVCSILVAKSERKREKRLGITN